MCLSASATSKREFLLSGLTTYRFVFSIKMCEGPQETATSSNQNARYRRSHQVNNHDSNDEGDASEDFDSVDGSPLVYRVSDGWQQCELTPRTPQHIVTLVARNPATYTWSASPILWKDRYLITPTLSGQILFWDLTKALKTLSYGSKHQNLDDKDGELSVAGKSLNDFSYKSEVSEFLIRSNHTPDLVLQTMRSETDEKELSVALGTGAAIIQICIGSPAVIGSNQEALVCISVTGFVYVFRLNCTNLTLVTLASSFSTGKPDLQCVSTTRKGLIIVGYHSGRLESWKLEARNLPIKAAISSEKSEGHEVHYRRKLLWRGSFTNAPEIRSVLQLQHAKLHDSDSNERESSHDSSDEYLILTIQQEEMTSTAAMIEVINISSVQKAWQTLLQHDDSTTEVGLNDFAILARPGMEIKNPTTSSLATHVNDGIRHRPWAPTNGTDCLVGIERSLPDGSMLACAAILAEGSVLLVTTYIIDGEFEWGVQGAGDQLLLSFPAIGVGYSSLTIDEDNIPHVVCCLRGGTSYLIPCRSGNSIEKHDSLSVITYPHDIDTDNPPHRVDFFSSGFIKYPAEDRKFTKTTIPILIFCWPGGIIDIYASELLQERKTYTNVILSELLSNGTVQLFRDYLLSLDEETLALHQASWRLAREEVTQSFVSDPIVLSDLLSGGLQSFCSILLSQTMDDSDVS